MASYKNNSISVISLLIEQQLKNIKEPLFWLFLIILIFLGIGAFIPDLIWLSVIILICLIGYFEHMINSFSIIIKSLKLNNSWLITYNLWDRELHSIRISDIKEIIINQYYLPNLITLKIEEKTTTNTIKKELEIDFMDAQVWIDLAKAHQIKLAKIYEYNAAQETKTTTKKEKKEGIVLSSKQGISLNDWLNFIEKQSNIWQWQPNEYFYYPMQPHQIPLVHNFKWLPSMEELPVLIQHFQNKLVLSNVPIEQFDFIKEITNTFNLKAYDTDSQPISLIS